MDERPNMNALFTEPVLCWNACYGIGLFRVGDLNRNGLSVLNYAYKAILMVLYPTDPVNLNSCPNPKFKKLSFVHNWQ